jgi:glycosyltransferase involved in cell wall biosynthesis
VTPSLDTVHASGIDVHVHELTRALLSKGIEVAVYTSEHAGNDPSNAEFHRFPVYGVSNLPSIVRNVEAFQTLVKRAWLPIHTSTFFDKLRGEHDLIHIHGHEYPISFIAMMAALSAGIPTVLTMHGVEVGLMNVLSFRLLRRLSRPTFFSYVTNNADVVVAPSTQVLQTLEKYRPKRVAEIPHGIFLDRFRGVERRSDYVLYLGRLFPEKRPEILVKAIPLILSKVDTRFVVAGYGSQRLYLEDLTRKLGVSDSVEFIDTVPYDMVPKILADAAVFVSPGISGYTLLEAAAARVPIVSGRIGWNISCVGRDSAIYVNPNNVGELSEAVVRLLTDDKLARELTDRARGFVESYRSWDVLTDRYMRLYESVLKAR